jgi:hypothetical protein
VSRVIHTHGNARVARRMTKAAVRCHTIGRTSATGARISA